MKTFIRRAKAFTLVELLVVISIIAILAGLAFPAMQNAIAQANMTATLNNMQQIQKLTLMAALDGNSTADSSMGWPQDIGAKNVSEFIKMLTDNGYLNDSHAKLFSATGVPPVAKLSDITGDKSAFRIYNLSDTNAGNAVFLITKNHPGPNGKELNGQPYADKGFVVVKKDGSGGKYNKNQAPKTNLFGSFQSEPLK